MFLLFYALSAKLVYIQLICVTPIQDNDRTFAVEILNEKDYVRQLYIPQSHEAALRWII